MPKILDEKDSKTAQLESVSSSTSDNVYELAFMRPDAMNALDPNSMIQLDGKLTAAKLSQKPIVLKGTGKAFVAGADIKFFVDSLKNNDYPSVHNFAVHGQKLFALLSDCCAGCSVLASSLSLSATPLASTDIILFPSLACNRG